MKFARLATMRARSETTPRRIFISGLSSESDDDEDLLAPLVNSLQDPVRDDSESINRDPLRRAIFPASQDGTRCQGCVQHRDSVEHLAQDMPCTHTLRMSISERYGAEYRAGPKFCQGLLLSSTTQSTPQARLGQADGSSRRHCNAGPLGGAPHTIPLRKDPQSSTPLRECTTVLAGLDGGAAGTAQRWEDGRACRAQGADGQTGGGRRLFGGRLAVVEVCREGGARDLGVCVLVFIHEDEHVGW